jgi:hypothetical protein
MPTMQRELAARPELGCLDDLDRFSRDPELSHLDAWRRFNRAVSDSGDVGIWHEASPTDITCVPSAGFEPAHMAPEANALSPELRGRATAG